MEVKILFVGQCNSGKSTLINSLLFNQDYQQMRLHFLPTGDHDTTHAIWQIKGTKDTTYSLVKRYYLDNEPIDKLVIKPTKSAEQFVNLLKQQSLLQDDQDHESMMKANMIHNQTLNENESTKNCEQQHFHYVAYLPVKYHPILMQAGQYISLVDSPGLSKSFNVERVKRFISKSYCFMVFMVSANSAIGITPQVMDIVQSSENSRLKLNQNYLVGITGRQNQINAKCRMAKLKSKRQKQKAKIDEHIQTSIKKDFNIDQNFFIYFDQRCVDQNSLSDQNKFKVWKENLENILLLHRRMGQVFKNQISIPKQKLLKIFQNLNKIQKILT